MTRLICKVPYEDIYYPIEIGNGILQSQWLSQTDRLAIITDQNVKKIYGNSLRKSYQKKGFEAHLFSFPSGEKYKTRKTKENLENQLWDKGFGRDSCIIALGGGVVTDLAGFIAATFCRGVPLIMMPTSLLAMVDASIGGKNGINSSYGKNLLGSIYHPKKVVIDTAVLQTLPLKELSYGIVEMIKHGLIADFEFFEYLEKNRKGIVELNLELLEIVIFRSCEIKKKIIEQDEKEKGIRRLLNFGHTIGHALEQLTGYSLPHGEAVAIGLLVESYISYEMGFLDLQGLKRIKNILFHYYLVSDFSKNISFEAIVTAMEFDKKSLQGRPRFIAIKGIGKPLVFNGNYCTFVDEQMIKKAVYWVKNDCCCD